MAGIHSFFKSVRYEQEKAARSVRQALSEGHEGDALTNRIAELEAHPTQFIIDASTQETLKTLYMAQPKFGSPAYHLGKFANANLVAKVIAPFMKIGPQIAAQAIIEHSPLGLASSRVRGNLIGRGGTPVEGQEELHGPGAAADEQFAKMAVGTAIVSSMVGMAASGILTGDGPPDPEKRAVWELINQSNHIQIGDITIPYRGLGWVGQQMAFAANMYDTSHWDDPDDTAGHRARDFFVGLTKSFLDESWMKGVKDALDAAYDPKEHGDRYIKQFVTNWLPYSVGTSQVGSTRSFGPSTRARVSTPRDAHKT